MLDGLKPYSTYAGNDLEWVPASPEHWRVLPAMAVFRERQVKNAGLVENRVLSLSFGRIIVKPEEKLRGLVPESFETYQIVDPGNIIVRTTDLQNDQTSLRVGQVRDRGIITSAYMCLEVRDGVLPAFGYQLLNAYDHLKILYGYGSGLRQSLDFKHIKRMRVAVPPPDEQAAIVRFLDHADRRIRRYIRAKQKLIKLLEEQKQAIVHQAVTRGLDPSVPMKHSPFEGHDLVPAHWRTLALKRVLRRLVDCEHKTAPMEEGTALLVVRTTAVRHGRLRLSGTYPTSEAAFAAWTRRAAPEAGDVIFTREAPAGEACVVPEGLRACLGQRTVLMKLRRDEYDPHFLVHTIYGGPPATMIELASQGSTVGHFNMDDIANLPVYVPPLDEQESIVSELRSRLRSLDAATEGAEAEIRLLRELRTRLIADVVTGQLDVRAAAAALPDEPTDDEALDDADEPGDDDLDADTAPEDDDA